MFAYTLGNNAVRLLLILSPAILGMRRNHGLDVTERQYRWCRRFSAAVLFETICAATTLKPLVKIAVALSMTYYYNKWITDAIFNYCANYGNNWIAQDLTPEQELAQARQNALTAYAHLGVMANRYMQMTQVYEGTSTLYYRRSEHDFEFVGHFRDLESTGVLHFHNTIKFAKEIENFTIVNLHDLCKAYTSYCKATNPSCPRTDWGQLLDGHTNTPFLNSGSNYYSGAGMQ